MEISTAVNLTDGRSKLRIVSMEITHVGSSLVLDGQSDFLLFSTGVENTSMLSELSAPYIRIYVYPYILTLNSAKVILGSFLHL